MKKGFTLIELVVVLIIVAVLGTLGLTQYTQLIEKARGAEAKEILGSIRKLAAAYYMEWNSVLNLAPAKVGIGSTDGMVPSACAPSHYFSYALIPVPTANIVSITATRCIGGAGKSPTGSSAGTLTLASTLSTGTDTWGGTGNY